jgi:Ras-related protein Rab-11B
MIDNDEEYDMILKILIIGDSGVGKSNLLLRYVKNEFSPDLRSTVGVEFGYKMLKIDDLDIKAQIWDTAGQERYKAITSAYYKGAKGVLIVYDITRKQSYENLENWLNDFKMKSDENASIVIIGNKSDLIEKREIDTEEAKNFASLHNLAFFETSAKENENVDKAFYDLVSQIVKNIKHNLNENFTNVYERKRKRKNSGNNKYIEGLNGENIRIDNSQNEIFDHVGIEKKNKCC